MAPWTTGANGVVTGNTAGARECLDSFDPGTLLRQVLIIGHRGLPSVAQENSLASAMAAYEAGANAIECDVYLSKDGISSSSTTIPWTKPPTERAPSRI